MNAITGLNAPRIAAATVKLIKMAENDRRNGMFNPSNGASIPLMSALPSVVSRMMSGNLIATKKRLLRVAPPAHRRAVKSRTGNDDSDVEKKSSRAPLLKPIGDDGHLTAQQRADFRRVWLFRLHVHKIIP